MRKVLTGRLSMFDDRHVLKNSNHDEAICGTSVISARSIRPMRDVNFMNLVAACDKCSHLLRVSKPFVNHIMPITELTSDP